MRNPFCLPLLVFTLFIWASALAALFALLTVITYLAFYTPSKR